MKTYLPSCFQTIATACAFIVFALAPSKAATMSASSTAPVIDDADIANYGYVSGTDKWFMDAARGQSITTGGAAVRLKSISYQVSEENGATPTKTYTVRVGRISGTNFTQIHSETVTQNFSWTGGQFMTWIFDTPVLLEPYTTYGIDVGMTSSTSGWNTGIPYINVTADDFAGGTSYSTGAAGIGTASISSSIASDRIFHLDIERPLGPVFSLVSLSPADNATGAYASREIVMTFSQNVAPGSGSLTIRNLTDNTSAALAPNDSRITYDQNVVRIIPTGLLTWNKNYAIRYDAGFFLGDASAPIPAITDDTTWNFATIASDPLLSAIAALKSHILGTTTLTGPQISAHKTTIDDQRQRFAENTDIINAVFDLITTYDTAKGPIFVSGFANNSTSFDRSVTTGTAKNSINPENYHWVIYTVMQHAMDLIYTSENLAKYESTLTNYKFGSHTSFPGPCSPPANPSNTHTVQINGSFPATFGRDTLMWTTPARKPTGTYLAPGTIATVTVPPALVNAGYKVRVGAHSWDLSARRPVNRLERATRLYSINSTTTKIASPYGGGIYIEVPYLANAGVVSVSVTGAVRSPYFSAKTFHQTTATEWDSERANPAPWADFQSDKFMFQVPRKWVYNMTGAQAVQLMVDWDKAMDAINDLMGFDRNRGKETMYCQTDVILRSSVHAPGYPAVNVTSNVNSEVSPVGYAGNYLVRGPATTLTAANIEFHEQGHGYFFPKFGGENESNVNLLQPAMLYRGFGKTIDEAQNGSFGSGKPFITVDNTAIAWMCVFSFSPNEIPMQDGEKDYQHKGHAKWMDIARIYATPSNPNAGWEKLDAYWRSFMLDDANNVTYGNSTDDYLLRLSRAVGKDIRPLFHFWGIHPQNPSALAAALAAENLYPDPAIKAKLLHYKSIVPANNAAFRTFMLNWWGRQPSVTGYWEETDHAMQWDSTLDADGSNNPNVRPNGSIYVETSATEIRNRIDELVELYFAGSITPNPMTFATAPAVVNSTTVGMAAATATAGTGPIQYFFDETSGNPGGDDSGWQSSPIYQDSGLTPGLTYSYTVSARDGVPITTDPSAALSVTPTASGDITPPTPATMTFSTPPVTVDQETITMTASTASDINGVEYYFENTTNSTNSGWQDSPVYTETNLALTTLYTYRVQARDKSANQNATAFSAPASANTANLPDVTSPQVVTFSPAGGSSVSNLASNLVVTFDEPVIKGTGSITLKNLSNASEVVFDINDPAVTISGSSITLNPPADLLYEKNYAVQISSGAVADASNNPSIGINDDTTWAFVTLLANPIVNSGGPYVVPTGSSLSLNGSAIPSTGATIAPTGYAWDMNRDNVFGEVTGSTPTAISDTVLMGTYGMVLGQNTIKLKVTDSLGNNTTVTTIVKIGANMSWDANGSSANHTDGAGAWLDANKWRDNGVNTTWISGSSAIFGNNGNGGVVTLGANTSVGSLTFNSFNGTYTISGGGVLTINNGFTNNSTAGAVSISTHVILTAPQTWGGTSSGALTFTGGINNNGHTLTLGVNGNIPMNAATNIISGSGGLTKSGSGTLTLGGNPAPAHTYSGPTTINGGVVMVAGNKTVGNMTLNNAMLTDYYRATTSFTGGLGTGNNQIQIYGDSGFGGGNGNSTWRIGAAGSVLTWGSTHFNPTSLKFLTSADNMGPSTYGQASLDNGLNLNGAARTISVLAATGANAITSSWGRINGVISGSGGSLIKTGGGNLILSSANTYDGGTTIQAGMLQLGSATSLGATSGPLTVNGGILNLQDQNVSVGNLTGSGGAIANNASNARTFTIGTGNGTGGIYQGVIANKTGSGTGSLALTKTGSGTITLAGSNTYTGATIINGGGTLFLTGATQSTSAISFVANSSLGLAIGSPVTATAAAVNFANGRVSVTGSPTAASHTLLTAASFTGTPLLAAAIPGYELVVVGNQLLLNQVVIDPYAAWSGGLTFNEDANNDGITNGLAWVLGAASPHASATELLPTIDRITDPNGKMLFIFRRATNAKNYANASILVEYGSNLGSWITAVHQGTSANQITISEQTNGFGVGIDRVTVALPANLANDGKIFARLKTVMLAP